MLIFYILAVFMPTKNLKIINNCFFLSIQCLGKLITCSNLFFFCSFKEKVNNKLTQKKNQQGGGGLSYLDWYIFLQQQQQQKKHHYQ